MYRLQCKTQSYDWGKLGDVSKVAHFAKQSGSSVDPEQPYAELWMGTHPNAPSTVIPESTPLRQLIKDKVSLSTQAVYDQYQGDLPFLFKVLSIRKALSIQAHPDKTLGTRLFKEFPNNYKDPNHKPEMAIALTPFEALCGFRPLNEIVEHFTIFPEFAELVGESSSQLIEAAKRQDPAKEESETVRTENKAALKAVFSALMKSPANKVTLLLDKLVHRLKEKTTSKAEQLVLRLDSEYPGGDIGVFAVLMLNYVEMQPRQAIFLCANEPHAYLSGDCVECMAASDNVVRAGLTPKFKDVDVLVDMLTYRYGSAESQKMTPVKQGNYSQLYDPPIDEFAVLLTEMKATQQENHEPIAGPSILIVTNGSGELTTDAPNNEAIATASEGHVYFIGADIPLTIIAGQSGFECYRAYAVAK